MSLTNPLLSVITVVLNDKNGLLKTINSIKSQINIEYEHIVVDGGSTDGSAEIAQSASSVPIESKADGGIYQGMQRGADVANGKYLLFCNSGDEIYGRDYLSKAISVLEKDTRSKKWGFGPIIEFTARRNFSWVATEGKTDLDSISSRSTFVPFPSFIVTKELFSTLDGFSFDYRIAGDFHLIVRCAQKESPVHWSQPIALFSAGGISYTKADLAWKEEHHIRNSVLNLGWIAKWRSFTSVYRRITKWYLGKALDLMQQSGLFGKVHWRDRRKSNVPAEFNAYLPK